MLRRVPLKGKDLCHLAPERLRGLPVRAIGGEPSSTNSPSVNLPTTSMVLWPIFPWSPCQSATVLKLTCMEVHVDQLWAARMAEERTPLTAEMKPSEINLPSVVAAPPD